MDDSIVSPKTFILKMNIHCKGCEIKLRKFIKKIHGVNTVAIDAETGKITILATIDPEMVINALYQKVGRKAELFQEEQSPLIPISKNPNILSISQPKPVQVINHQQMVTQLEGFPDMKDLKNVEITYSVKLSFKDNKDDSIEEEIVKVNGANMYHGSCCGIAHKADDCHGYQHQGTHENFCRCNSRICGWHTRPNAAGCWPPPSRGYVPSPGPQPPWTSNVPSTPPPSWGYAPFPGPQPPWTSNVIPSAPPLSPQVVYAYPSTFNTFNSDDNNSKSCTIF